jgi:hypothetical protein
MTTAWSVLLFAGGMIFLVYFFSIHFMPELNPQASITLLAASILTAGFILLAMILGLFAPFVFWKTMMPSSIYKRLQALWYKDEQFAPVRAILWVGLPFLVLVIVGISFLDSTIFKQLGIGLMWGLASLAVIVFILPSMLPLLSSPLEYFFSLPFFGRCVTSPRSVWWLPVALGPIVSNDLLSVQA